MKREFRLRFFSFAVIIYIMAAVLWWSVLLFRKNEEYFETKSLWYMHNAMAKGLAASEADYYNSDMYIDLQRRYNRQKLMIVGESAVFFLSLVMGMWFINRGYLKEAAASRQRRNFLLSITHELKSPIAGIQLAAETLMKRELPREQRDRLLHNTLKETDRLKNLVNDLLLSAKLESAYQVHREPLEWEIFLNEIIANMRIKYPRAFFECNIPNGLPHFEGDRSGLSSVVQNLLENAVKYSPEPAKVDVRVATQGSVVVLEVADQGIGIPEKERRNVFGKFYRIGSEDTRQTKGTGLGLYIVDQIVKAHNGTIAVLDNKPAGTVFRIELPLPKS